MEESPFAKKAKVHPLQGLHAIPFEITSLM